MTIITDLLIIDHLIYVFCYFTVFTFSIQTFTFGIQTPHHTSSKNLTSNLLPSVESKIAGWVANSVDPGVSSGSTLFAQVCLKQYM